MPFPPQLDTLGAGADLPSQFPDDFGDAMVAESTLATGIDQTVSPNSTQTTGIIGHNI